MANERYISRTDASGTTVISRYTGGTAYCSLATGARYTAFFKCTPSGSTNAQLLVAGVGRYNTGFPGLYLVNVCISGGALSSVQVKAIIASTTTPTFGYYTDGDDVYVGVYTPASTAPITATLLGAVPTAGSNIVMGQAYQSATAPTGWTAVTIS